MTTYPERQQLVLWIHAAVTSGARRFRACETVGISIRTLQRWTDGAQVYQDRRPLATRPEPANKLSERERQRIIDVCTSEEFADVPPSRIVPILADRQIYIACESSFYRVLKAHQLTHHRGRAKPRGTYSKPQTYTAVAPNQVWTWDITHLPATVLGLRFYLYMILDIYSRKIIAAEVYDQELGEYASELLQHAVWREQPEAGLVLHSDNGAPMKSFTLQAKMYDLGIAASHSRPRVSNDNPYSEALFRTLKYCPPMANRRV